MSSAIVIIEDDENQREFLKKLLSDNGYSVRMAANGTTALRQVENLQPDLVLLDLGLPDIQGESLFQELKNNYPDLPIIILTARDSTKDIVEGLNLGADDYIPKPYSSEELLARIKARLRHLVATTKLKVADLSLDSHTLEVKRGSKVITLTPKEFKLLEYLMLNKNRVLSRDMILSRIWMYSPDMETRAVDVYIGYLRKKIDADLDHKLIHSVRGYGYMIKE